MVVLNELICYWRQCKDELSLKQLCGTMLRAARALPYAREHRRLWSLPVYSDYLATPQRRNRLHHLSQRHYVRKSLSARQRIRWATGHYSFEGAHFDDAYLRAIYQGKGLELWRSVQGDLVFSVRLMRGSTQITEGDLALYLMVGEDKLHTISFSWVSVPAPDGSGDVVVPFIARSQMRWRREPVPLEQFDQAFPQNAVSYFCYAALQGVARVIGAPQVLAVNSMAQCCYDPADTKHFAGAYDGFWQVLGGEPHDLGYAIPVPFHVKPLEEVSAKHRKRAAMRREHWRAIEASVVQVLAPHFTVEPAVRPIRPEAAAVPISEDALPYPAP